jgi:hypothetical protein
VAGFLLRKSACPGLFKHGSMAIRSETVVLLKGHPAMRNTFYDVGSPVALANRQLTTRDATPLHRSFSSANDSTNCLHQILLDAITPPIQQKILTDLLDHAERSDSHEKQAIYVALIRLVHCWPSCRCTSFRTSALIRLTSQLLHQTDAAVRDLIHLAIEQLKTHYGTDSES